jgi:DNA repair protein RecO (recombination protein O)
MHRHLKTEAVVLKRKNLLERDALVTLFTREEGKITATAKGVRSLVSRRISSLMTGNLIRVVLYRRSDYYYLQTVEMASLFSHIKRIPNLQKELYFFLYVLDQLLPERVREDNAYTLLKKFLVELSKNNFSRIRTAHYCNRLLELLGYSPRSQTLSESVQRIQEITGKKIPSYII